MRRRRPAEPPWRALILRTSCLVALIACLGLIAAWSGRDDVVLLKKEAEHPVGGDTVSLIDYRRFYDGLSSPAARIFGFTALVIWLVFLFSFVGVTASDFFSPNLATLSSRLGLSEAVAGSTLLAFGNGSPDVFSTFAALRSNSGSLAVGELLGAASFIVSFVAGSMCLVGEFKVAKHAFLRDVGFFLMAVVLFAAILIDGKLAQAEAGSMIVLYLLYVVAVTVGSWWHQRKLRQKELMRKIRSEYANEELYRDEPNSPLLAPRSPVVLAKTFSASRSASPLYSPAASDTDDDEGDDEVLELADADAGFTVQRIRGRARSSTSASMRPMARSSVRPSLLSAVEFRDVVNSLRAESADERALGVFRAGNHRRTASATFPRHRRHTSGVSTISNRSPTGSDSGRREYFGSAASPKSPGREGRDAFAAQFGQAIEQQRAGPLIDLTTGERNPWQSSPDRPERPQVKLTIPEHLNGDACTWADSPQRQRSLRRSSRPQSAPIIVVTDASPGPERTEEPLSEASKRFAHVRQIFATLFPSLQDLGSKSFLGISLAVLSVPAILALTLTLPVVDEEMEGSEVDSLQEKADEEDEQNEQARRRDVHIAHRLHAHDAPSPLAFDAELVDAGLSHLQEGLRTKKVPEHAIASPQGTPVEGLPIITEAVRPTVEQIRISHILAVVQCAVAPFFVLLAATGGEDVRWWYVVISAACSATLALIAFYIETTGRGRLFLCFCGFTVAVLWIMSVVNEVVGVLQAFGHILGLSDALIGLTIFAVGNSLGDLVSNLTIARMGYQVMAISACYGGPMLNILLGVGVSGTYFTASTGKPYHIRYSWSLMTTSVALLVILVTTLIVVPMNDYVFTRRWGIGLMASYGALLTVNVLIEVILEKNLLK